MIAGNLAELAAPGHTAIVTQECQGAVIGPNAGLALLAEEARRVALPNITRLLPVARSAGVRVVHCVVQRRPDGLGSNHNAKIFAIGRGEVNILPGTPGAAVLPELGPEPTDLVLSRWHGVGPMGGTDLDAVLRNLGVSTIVVVGVSLNIAIPNVVMDAVNAAYRVVVPRDAVAGIPTEYGNAIIDNTLSLLATITTHRRSAPDMGPAGQGDFVTDAADTAPAARGGFPEVRPVEDAPPELGRFVAAMRRLQDLTVSTNPNSSLWADAAAHLESACALLDGHQVPETQVVAGRVLSIPGLGHPLMPPWTLTELRARRCHDGRALHRGSCGR